MRVLLITLVVLLACGDDGSVDAFVDSGTDSGDVAVAGDLRVRVDTSRPPFDAGPRWTSAWDEVLEGAHVACDDWNPVEPLPRGLPEDSSLRELWRLRARDPGIDRIGEILLSPDGTVWVHGPTPGGVTQISRDGERLRTREFQPREVRTPLRPFAVTPEGQLIVIAYSEAGGRGRVFAVPPFPVEGGTGPLSLPLRAEPSLAVGPGGLVYIGFQDNIAVTCRALDQIGLYRFRRRRTPDPTRWWAPRMIVNTDDQLEVTSGTVRTFLITAEGGITWEQYDVLGAMPHWPRLRLERTPLATMEYAGPNALQVRFGEILLQPEVATRDTFRLAPNNDVWDLSEEGQPRRYTPPYDEEPEVVEGFTPHDYEWVTWLADGGYLRRVVETIQRISRDGEVLWTLETPRLSVWALDPQGVLYWIANDRDLVAVQTDALPPTLDSCFDQGRCNGYHDRWMHRIDESIE